MRFPPIAMALMAALVWPSMAPAQQRDQSSFKISADAPVKIEADKLDIQDASKSGTFSGNVVVVQGDMTLKTSKLVVYYSGSARAAATGASDGGSNASSAEQKITKLEARGKVYIRSKDQEATGEWADYHVSTRKIRLGGNVVLSQGENVLRGDQLLVDLNAGTSRLTTGKSRDGRVRGLFLPGQVNKPRQ